MEDKNWNPKDWQGRSKRQVESNYKILGWSFILTISILTVGFLISLI